MKKMLTTSPCLLFLIACVSSIEIQRDPSMTQGQQSYIFCYVGSASSGVLIYKRPALLQANCPVVGDPCVSNEYSGTLNATGALLTISSVDIAKETGDWYCTHAADTAADVTVNSCTIRNLAENGFAQTQPTSDVHSYTVKMVVSGTSTFSSSILSFTYDSGKTIPSSAVSIKSESQFNGTTCPAGYKFHEATLTASNTLSIFDNKKDVSFEFTFYGSTINASSLVSFLEDVIIICFEVVYVMAPAIAVWLLTVIIFLIIIANLVIVLEISDLPWKEEHNNKESKEYKDIMMECEKRCKNAHPQMISFHVKVMKKDSVKNNAVIEIDIVSKGHKLAKNVLYGLVIFFSLFCFIGGLACIIYMDVECSRDYENWEVNMAMSCVAFILGILGIVLAYFKREYAFDKLKKLCRCTKQKGNDPESNESIPMTGGGTAGKPQNVSNDEKRQSGNKDEGHDGKSLSEPDERAPLFDK